MNEQNEVDERTRVRTVVTRRVLTCDVCLCSVCEVKTHRNFLAGTVTVTVGFPSPVGSDCARIDH